MTIWSLHFAVTTSCNAVQPSRETRDILGWSLHIDQRLLASQTEQTEKAVRLLTKQLEEIVRVVPKPAVEKLKQVPLYFSPPYEDRTQKAEFHPSAGWLRDNGRDPVMAQAVEFTNIAIFEQESVRMPNFALHELSHAFHFKFIESGFDNADVNATFERAKASGKYEKVERWFGSGRPNSTEKAYALTNAMEYFAESSEAYFTKNDFFPFIKSELREFDLLGYEMIERIWKIEAK